MRSRQNTHGIMKYRGSTKGAVTSERELARRSMRADEVGGGSDANMSVGLGGCEGRGRITVTGAGPPKGVCVHSGGPWYLEKGSP